MSEFGWAYIGGALTGSQAKGVSGSVQYKKGTTNEITGSDKFVYDETDGLVLSGNLVVSGTLTANEYRVNVVDETVTNLYSSGSTKFGNTADDTHEFTGSVFFSNTNFSLSGASDSALIYQSGSTFLTTSNPVDLGLINDADPNDITFIRAVNPTLVVSGTSVFNDPVSIQGGLFGASPIDVYAPFRYKATDDDDDLLIERGKFIGRVEISSSNAEHGLFLEGAARIKATTTQADSSDLKPEVQFVNNVTDQTTYPVIDLRKYGSIAVEDHPQIDGNGTKRRRHDQYTIGDIHFATQLPILTGSDSSSLDNYEMTTFRISRITTTVDARRNAYQINFLTNHTNFDPDYEIDFAADDASLTTVSGALDHPFTSSDFKSDTNSTVNTLIVGSFSAPGQGNIYGLKRGIMVGGNILPMGADLRTFGGGEKFESHHGTIGHPVARWGDMYIHDDRYIRWGQAAGDGATDAYKRFVNSNPLTASARIDSGSVVLGFSTSSNMLEVSGSPMYLLGGASIAASGYINYGTVTGSDGYGIRDNSGTLQFKNQSGDWEDFGTGTGDSFIGAAEDGDYTDGLFTDFTTSTLVGVPIDRFNEVLKILAPEPAPALSRINYTNTAGGSAKLSFDSSNTITDYANSATGSGFDAVTRNNIYESETSGSNERLGIYDGTQDIEGVLNFNVSGVSSNGYDAYVDDAFGNAEAGSLKLELNGTVIHTVDLTSFGSGNSYLNTTGSGFTAISVTASSFDGNGAEWYIFKHRTAQYKVDTLDQRDGWNYARAVHTIGSTDYETNYVEWINDSVGAAQALSVSNARIEDVFLTGSKFVSGVEYNTDLTASYKAEINNIYRNVYPDGNIITFNETNCDPITAQSASALGVGEDETKVAQVTASVNNDQNLLLNGSISVSLNATHPLKSNLSNSGLASITGMLIDNDTSSPNSNLSETFIDEDFRITSGSYDTQTSASSATWDSTVHMTSSGISGYNDGMIQFNRRLYNPVDDDLPGDGNFASLANVETGQPDYSSESGIKTYFRKIQNDSSGVIRDMKITSQKNGFKFGSQSGGLSSTRSRFYVKIPGSTGFMNIRENFVYGSTSDNDGAYINGANDNSNVDGNGNSVFCVTFGTESVAVNEYVVVKIETNGMEGYVSQLDFQLGASDVADPTEALALDDVNVDNSGSSVNLSFGTSNTISGYSNVTGSGTGSLSDIDINGYYSNSGDRRGVFQSARIISGTLNQDVGANGSNYTAFSFKDAYTGSVVLEVNGVEVHTSSLDNLNAITNDFNGNSSGFSLSSVSFSETTDGIPDYTKPYRTGTYQIGTADQNTGWNYARVIHRIGGTDVDTNYVQWVIDPSGSTNDTAVSTPTLSNFNHSDVYYQSGIGYFASQPSASFAFTASNFYRNVYQNGTAIDFPTTNLCSISNIRITGSGVTTFDSAVSSCNMPLLNSSSNCHLTDIHITGTVLFVPPTSISGAYGTNNFTHYDVSVSGRVQHPFKSNRTTSQASKTSFMVYSGSNGSTTLADQEYFNTETYRIVSGNYATQAAVTSSSNAWNSQRSMNDGASYPEYNDGMVTVNGYLIPPFSIGNLGDTRNVSDGGDLQAPSGNPDYSTSELSESVRTYYRYFRNTGVTTVQNFNIYVEGDASIVAKTGSVHYGALGANNRINIEMKVPGQTAWGDVAIPQGGVDPTSDGDGIFNGGNGNLDQDASNGSNIAITLGTLYWDTNDYIVLKISAHKNWTGYLTEITASY